MHWLSSIASFKYSLRLTLFCLLAIYALLQPLPARVHSSNQPPTQQSFAPEINTGPLGSPREGHTATLLQNGKVLVTGGRQGSSIYNTAEVYDPVTATWAPTANALANARYGHSAVLLRTGQVLVIGGQGSSGFLDSAEIYDPSDNSWKSALLSRMNAARFHLTATMLADGRVLVAGGQNSSGILRGAELYNPTTRAWSRLDTPNNPQGNLTEARAEHTATLLNDGRVLVAGGFNGSAATKSAELFEPSVNRWRRVGDLQSARRLHTATLLPDGTVLAAGGLSGANALGSSETYNPASGAWTATTGGFTARRAHTATLLPNGRVLAAGGKNSAGGALNSAELYNYQTRSWSNALLPYLTSSFVLNTARSDHTATLLMNGQVLFAGGLDSDNAASATAELYGYAVGFWSVTKNAAGATTQLNLARLDHTATLLPNGKVLVAGGYALSNIAATLSTCELYDPATGAWAVTGSLNAARAGHTATLLANGKVLVVGGYLFNPNGTIAGTTSDAELYDPVTGGWTPAADSGVFRFRHTATLLPDGRVLVVGGSVASVQLYNPATDTWSNTASLSPARNNHSATLLPNGNVFVFGGLSADARNVFNTGAIFNPTNGAWTSITFTNPTPAFRLSHKATLLPNGKVFISGGYGGLNTSDVGNVVGFAEVYNIATNRFENGRVTIGSRVDHTATLLPNGKVLLVGGLTVSQSFSNCLFPPSSPQAALFDPSLPLGAAAVTELYDQFAPLQARNAHTATLLTNGKVLVVGGQAGEMLPQCLNQNFVPTSLRHTELYDSGLGNLDNWRPVITHFSAPGATSADGLTAPDQAGIVANGVQFQGISEASGHGAASSASNYPLAQLRSLLNEQLTIVPVSSANGGWTNNTFAYTAPAGFPTGPALLTIFANGIPSIARVVNAPGGDLVPANASPTGTISGRVVMHNGVGLSAAVTLTPTAASPTGCSGQRTLTTGPNGEFTFQDVVVSPKPIIDCSGNRNLACTNSTANGCNLTYTPPAASPAGTAVSCLPNSGAFFPLGTTTVNCTATNAAGSSTCSFPVTIVPFTLTCPQNILANITNGNGANINYPNPTPSVTNGTTVTCSPASGSFFPVGTTTVNCSATNPGSSAPATCGFTVTVRLQGLSLTCPANITRTQSSESNGAVVTYPPPTPSISGAAISCNPASGSFFPIGTTVVTCQATTGGVAATCRFNITVQPFSTFEKQPPGKTVAPGPAPQTTFAVVPLNNPGNDLAQTPTAPEQNQTNCRYTVQPAATVGNQPVGFFPATALFNMIEERGGTVSFSSGLGLNLTSPEQTGGQTCQYCTGNKFVSQTPYWNIAGRIQTQNGAGVGDVDLEFSVPYEICDDRLICQNNAGIPVSCNTPGAKTINGDPCAKASNNLLDPAAAFHCACTTLRNDGTCEKTVLARYPGPAGLRAPFEQNGNGGFDWRSPLFQVQPNGNYNVANVPNGANAVVTPSNRQGGTQYTFSYLPVSPPGLLPQAFVQIDQVTRSYDQQNITALTTCAAPNATITPATAQVCANSTGNTASVPDAGAGATYNWTITNGTITGGQSARIVTYTAGAAGSVMLNVTVSTGPTCSANNSATIPITPLPTANAGTDQTLCQAVSGTTAFAVTGTVANGSPAWSVVNTTGTAAATISSPNAATTNVNVTGTGTVTLRLTVTSNAGCPSTADEVVLTVTARPTSAAGPDQTLCQAASGPTLFNLSGTVANGAAAWSVVNTTGSAAGNILTPNNAATGVNVTGNGTVTLRLTATSNQGCGTATDEAVVTVTAAPTANAGADQALCQATTGPTAFTLNGTVANGTPAWSVVNTTGSASAAITSPNSATTGVNVSGAGTVTLRLTVTGGAGCAPVSDDVLLTVNGLPAVPAITAPATVCANSTNNQASGPAGASGYQWTISNGTITGGATTQTVTYTAGAAGSVTLNLTVSTGATCSASNSATIPITPLPTANAGADQTLCQAVSGTTAFTVTGTIANGSPAWSVVNSTGTAAATISSPNAATTNVNVTGAGTVTLRLTVTSSAGCPSTTDDVVLIVNPLPTAAAGPDQTLCQAASGTTLFNLAGAVANGAAAWSVVNTTGTAAANILTPNNAATGVNVTGSGTATLRLTATSNLSCGTATDDVVLIVTAAPTANAGADQALCQAMTVPTAFSLNGAAANGTPAWSVVSSTGTATAAITSPNSATTGVNVSGAGTVTLRLTVAGGAGCAPVSDDVLLTVNALPDLPAITAPATICANSTNNQASGPAGASGYQWTISNGTITGGATAQTVTYTAGASGNVSLTLRVTNAATCAASNVLNIPINTVPTVTTQPTNQTVCENSPVTFTAAANNSTSVQWQVSTDGGANFTNLPNANNTTLNFNASLGQNGARLRAVFTNACGTINTNAVTLTVNSLLSINTQPVSQAACAGAPVTFNVAANGTAPLAYQWRKNGAPIGGATNNSFTINAVASGDAGIYDVTITSGCGTATSNAATLTVNAFALSAANAAFQAAGGTGSVDLTATVGQCTWNAASNANANWITVTSVTSTSGTAPNSGTGNGRVNYSVAANTGTTARTGTLTIAGLTFTVTQSGSVPAARLDTLSQNSALAGSAGFTLTVTGASFTNTSVVRWNGSARTTNFVSATQLTAQITTADLATAGTFTIDVFDAPPGGGASNQLTFTVIQPNPSPTVSSLNPNSAVAGGSQFTLTVNGTNFINNSVVRWNGNARATSFISATQLTTTIPASDIANAGTAQVTVFNPAPGGGESGAVSFTIQPAPAAPLLGDITPDGAVTGGAGFTLTIAGGGFSSGSIVRWNGSDRPTTVVNSTRLTAAIPASDIATPGIYSVTVFTPPPGGGTTQAITFIVGSQAVNVSAASFARDSGAAEAITAVFGVELATETRSAESLPLPTSLAGTTVKVRDSLGAERDAPLFFVSTGQINYLIPQGTATGLATVIITSGNGKLAVATLDMQIVAPGIFTANSNGQGPPAALLLRVASNGQQTSELVAQFQDGRFVPRPLDLGPEGEMVFVILFGTGMRGRISQTNAAATLGGVTLPITFLGAQGDLAGLDQVNLGPLPRSLAGRGEVNLVLTVEGRAANTVQLNIR